MRQLHHFHQRNIRLPFSAILSATIIFLSFQISSCKKDIAKEPEQPSVQTADQLQGQGQRKAEITVRPGQSIQAAVDAAAPNSLIRILPGTYVEAVVVDKPGMELVGSEGVVIQNPGDKNNGITVRANGDGFTLRNVTVKDFLRNGVFMIRADNFLLSHVTAINDGEYGLYPIFCNNGKMEHCEATGHNDSGIYIGQSSDVEVSFNKTYGNVNGLEIENCARVTVSQNHCYENVAGILVVLLPGLPTKTGSDVIISNNQVNDNNIANFANAGEFESFVPSGTGILIVGSDRTTIENNKVRNNNFVGIATVSTLVLGALAGLPPEAFADIEPNPDGTRVIKNLLIANGTMPPAGLPLPAADLLWDGSGANNCWSNNQFATSFPTTLPTCN